MQAPQYKGIYILGLALKGVRCFSNVEIDFRMTPGSHPAQWTILLGENGTGKTTVLRSIASMLPAPRWVSEGTVNNKWLPFLSRKADYWDPVRNSQRGAELSLSYVASKGLEDSKESDLRQSGWYAQSSHLDAIRHEDIKHHELLRLGNNETVFLAAYGASRKMSHLGINKEPLDDACETLFDEDAQLMNPAELLYMMEQKSREFPRWAAFYQRVLDLLVKVLPDVKEIRREIQEDRFKLSIKLETPDGWMDLNDLSLGYKTTISWLVDFTLKMATFYRDSEHPLTEPAICLVDEIDLHMHPRWQRTIIRELSHTFPNTQFIATAHSPLIVQAAVEHGANIVVLRRDEKSGEVSVENEPEVVRHWRVDQLLASDLFREAAYGEITLQDINTYYDLKRKDQRTAEEERRMTELIPLVRATVGPDAAPTEWELKLSELLKKKLG